jgi:hypothetical protein
MALATLLPLAADWPEIKVAMLGAKQKARRNAPGLSNS